MRKLKPADFANAAEYDAYKRSVRKADVTKRDSTTGRKGFEAHRPSGWDAEQYD